MKHDRTSLASTSMVSNFNPGRQESTTGLVTSVLCRLRGVLTNPIQTTSKRDLDQICKNLISCGFWLFNYTILYCLDYNTSNMIQSRYAKQTDLGCQSEHSLRI